MTQPVRLPAPDTVTPMDPEHHQQPEESSAPAGPSTAVSAQEAKPSRLNRLPDNTLPTILGAALVLLLGIALTHTDDRISRLEDRVIRVEDRVIRLEEKFDAKFAAQDAKLDEINLKLTALIAVFNANPEVEAALEGRLLDHNATPLDQSAN